MRDSIKLLKVLFQTFRVWAISWFTFNIVLLIFFRGLIHQDKFNWWWQLVANIGFGTLYTVLAAALGIIFNPSNSKSWVRQLPLSQSSLSFAPQITLLLYGTALFIFFFDFWRIGFVVNGAPPLIVAFLMPHMIYYFMRSMRHYGLGFILANVINFMMLTVWVLFFHKWFKNLWELELDIAAGLALIAIALLLEREKKRYILLTTAFLGTLLLGLVTYHQNYKPQTLDEAANALTFYPSKNAVANFKSFATDRSLWRNVEVRTCPEKAYMAPIWVFAREFLTSEEQLQFTKIILDFPSNFECLQNGKDLIVFYPFTASQMIDPGIIQNYIMSHWKNESAYCELLPKPFEEKVIKNIFDSDCGRSLEHIYLSNYNPHRNSEFDRQFEAVILSAHKLKSIKVKQALSVDLSRQSKWIEKYPAEFSGYWLERHSMTPNQLKEWKEDFKKEERKIIREWIQLPREKFITTLWEYIRNPKGDDFEKLGVLNYLCNQINPGCRSPQTLEQNRSLTSLIKEKEAGSRYNDMRLYRLFVELTNEDAWPKIQALNGKI